MSKLLRKLVAGGHIAFYVYKKKAPILELCDDYIRQFTSRMSAEECLRVCQGITSLGKALSDLKVEINIAEDIPILQIKAGTYDLQRFVYWHVLKCYWNETLEWDMNCITNFDWYHPLHAHRHTPEEVREWCAAENLEIVHFDVAESGISVLARKTWIVSSQTDGNGTQVEGCGLSLAITSGRKSPIRKTAVGIVS